MKNNFTYYKMEGNPEITTNNKQFFLLEARVLL
jgi:hypothetical protein